eukprot:scaffold24789_cov50-Attheya_sp.AAC.1
MSGTPNLAPCVVFGSSFSSWLCCLGELDFRAVAVVLETDAFLPLIQSLVHEQCQIFVGKQANPVAVSANIGFVYGRITQGCVQWMQSLGLSTAVATRGLRRALPGWESKSVQISHSEVGGITTKEVDVTCLGPAFSGTPVPSWVLKDTVSFSYRPVPSSIHLLPLRCEQLGNGSSKYYHGGGLLPDTISRGTRVLTPTLFAPKGSWAVRCLSVEEVLLAHDWPMCLIESAADCCHTLPPLIPGKSLVAGFQQILGNGGGFSIFLSPPLPLPQLQVDSSLKQARSMSSESSSPVMKKPARVNPESESDLKSKSDVPTPGAPSIADSSHTPNQEPEPGPQIKDP